MSRRVVVGLGNPGARYEGTRHNVGFLLVDRLLPHLDSPVAEEREGSWRARGTVGGQEIILVKPLRFMNRSGPPLRVVLDEYEVPPPDCLVVHDDLDLPLGRIKLKRDGGTGGHRGLDSILATLGRDDFVRLRLGIGRPPSGMEVVDYVLQDFSPPERPLLGAVLERAGAGVFSWVEKGLDATMNRLNALPVELEAAPDGC